MNTEQPKGIGYWRGPDDESFPEPATLVRPNWISMETRDSLLRYLRSASMFCGSWGYSYCRFHCGVDDRAMGSRTYWDGVWAWPEGLAHYVEFHDVSLPDEFVRHALSVPLPETLPTPVLRLVKINWAYWIEWSTNCARNA